MFIGVLFVCWFVGLFVGVLIIGVLFVCLFVGLFVGVLIIGVLFVGDVAADG